MTMTLGERQSVERTIEPVEAVFPDFSIVDLTLRRWLGENAWEACNTPPLRCTVMPWPEIGEYDVDAAVQLAQRVGKIRLMPPDGYMVGDYPAGHRMPITLGEQMLQTTEGSYELFRVDLAPALGSVGTTAAFAAQQ